MTASNAELIDFEEARASRLRHGPGASPQEASHRGEDPRPDAGAAPPLDHVLRSLNAAASQIDRRLEELDKRLQQLNTFDRQPLEPAKAPPAANTAAPSGVALARKAARARVALPVSGHYTRRPATGTPTGVSTPPLDTSFDSASLAPPIRPARETVEPKATISVAGAPEARIVSGGQKSWRERERRLRLLCGTFLQNALAKAAQSSWPSFVGGLWRAPTPGRLSAQAHAHGPSARVMLVFGLAVSLAFFGGYALATRTSVEATRAKLPEKTAEDTASRIERAPPRQKPAQATTLSLFSAEYVARSGIGGARLLAEKEKRPGVELQAGFNKPEETHPDRSSHQEAKVADQAAPATEISEAPPALAELNAPGGPAAPADVETLRSRADQGDPQAQYELAASLFAGEKTKRDIKAAAAWLQKAADKGHSAAQLQLGILYQKGYGVNRDYRQARKWLQTAAENGNALAMHNLAVLVSGHQPADYVTAADWLRRAAELGVVDSQYNLAVAYAQGLGVDRDLIQSYAWFSVAAAQGDDNALRKRKETARLLSAEELNEAKALATSYKQRYRQPETDQKAANERAF